MRFLDEAEILFKAGKGGDGIVAWRREKFVPNGGPSGGNGGKGGDIIVVAHGGKSSLLDIKHQTEIRAEDGERGQNKNMHGKKGRDEIVFVPIGTQIFNAHTDEILADLTTEQAAFTLCVGGKGGLGNAHFKDPLCQAPHISTKGEAGQEVLCRLSLKLMADVGLVGFPNAGKSTLLSRLSNAKPKIADYPFTTLKPMVGVVETTIGQSFVMADVPGLIEGASLGYGLGTRFLRHLERVRVLCHLIEVWPMDEDDFSPQSVENRFNTICKELACFHEKLANLPQIIVFTKIDLLNDLQIESLKKLAHDFQQKGFMCILISSVAGDGIQKLKDCLWQKITSLNKQNLNHEALNFNPASRLYAY